MKKLVYPIMMFAAFMACFYAPVVSAEPITVGDEGYNPIATEHVREALRKTVTATLVLDNREHALTASETAALLALLEAVESSTPGCPPADCFYLNLQTADGTWLMSLPVQNTPQGIVLLYLKLQGKNAGSPLQAWWQGVAARICPSSSAPHTADTPA